MTDEERVALKKKLQERNGNSQGKTVSKQQVSKKHTGNRKVIAVLTVSVAILCVLVALFAVLKNKNSNTADNNTAVAKENKDVEPVGFYISSQDEYVRDGKKCILYRVCADKNDMTDDEMIVSFNTFLETIKDNYYLHDVMIYSSAEKVAGGGEYDVAEIEETADSKTPVITRKK